jgi:hypothetical protein
LENLENKDKATHAREHAQERGYVINQYGTYKLHEPQD